MKNKLTCYIIDDEPLAVEILKEYVAKVEFLELIGSFMKPLEASARISIDKPDLLFLDVNMPEIDGIAFISLLNPCPMIILTTAYDRFALKAYDLEVKDYLLKPISFERFYKGVLRLYQSQNIEQPDQKQVTQSTPDKEFLFLNIGHRIQKVSLREITFIEGMKDYLRVHTTSNKYMVLLSFAKLEEHLPPSNFVRVHRSFIVAIDKIDHIERNRISIGDRRIPVGETFKDNFFQTIKLK